jgi:hypothetical protein
MLCANYMRGRENDSGLALLVPFDPQTAAIGQRFAVCKYELVVVSG